MVYEIHIYSTHVTFTLFHLIFKMLLSLNAKLEYMIQYIKTTVFKLAVYFFYFQFSTCLNYFIKSKD